MSQPYNPYEPPRARPASLPDAGAAGVLLAERSRRLNGALVDGLVGIVGTLPAYALHAAGLDPFPARSAGSWFPSAPLFLLFSLIPDVVQWTLITRSGQSIGKKLVGTRIVTMDGRVAGFVHGVLLRGIPWTLMRAAEALASVFLKGMLVDTILTRGIPIVKLVEVLTIFGPARRCIHDYVAGTRVVLLRA
jgi:uncharacterized RDD family membrane protein YckC